MTGEVVSTTAASLDESPHVALATFLAGPGQAKYGRFILAVLGSIPWVGSLMAAAAALHAEREQGKVNELILRWVEEHEVTFHELSETIRGMIIRLEQIGEQVDERLSDERYLGLVRQGFRVWDEANTKEKRDRVRQTLTNAAGTRLCSDDVVRLFLQWIQQYNEIHFRVIQIIYKAPGLSRSEIWDELHGEDVRDDSADADLFKLMIRDLSTGSVIRQHKDTTPDGRFLRAKPRRARTRSPVLQSPFEDDKPYELTELGSQFVHYAMTELVTRIGSEQPPVKPGTV
jgi:hypothetical protein